MAEVKRNDVDIVTPVYGSPQFLINMLETITSIDAGGVSWRLTLVDDAYKGPDREKADAVYTAFKRDNRIRIVMSDKNLGFAGANNRGFSQGRAPLLLLLNSDTIIKDAGWLERMAREFDDPELGVEGIKLLFFEENHPNYEKSDKRPPGKVQHAGVVFNLIGQPYHIFLGWAADHLKVTQRRYMNAVTAACYMVRRSDYFKFNGLDTDYRVGNFEDVQLCLQIRAIGKKILYNPDVTLYHYAGGSGNTATAQFNETLFRLKCQNLIEYDEWKYW